MTDCTKCAWGTYVKPTTSAGEDIECRNRKVAKAINRKQMEPKDALAIFDEIGYLLLINTTEVQCRHFKER